MNLKKENEMIKFDAKYALIECENRADATNLERHYVITQFLKEFSKMVREKGYII